jgi:MFS family permease
MLGLGAIPAAIVIYQRRRLPETPRFLAAAGKDEELAHVVGAVVTEDDRTEGSGRSSQDHRPAPMVSNGRMARQTLWTRANLMKLMATAGSWFLIDVAFYGNGVSSQVILKALLPHSALAITTLVAGGIFLVAAIPGYFVAAAQMDRLGRRTIQIVGFTVMALAYAAIFLVPAVVKLPLVFLMVYGVSYFFTEFGPNTTTFLVPAEAFATNVRGTAHGISAAFGKFGAFAGAFLLPIVLKAVGLSETMGLLALVALLGAGLTIFFLPEMNQRSLETTEVFEAPPVAQTNVGGPRKLVEHTAH